MSLRKIGLALGSVALVACGGQSFTAPAGGQVVTQPLGPLQGASVAALAAFNRSSTVDVAADWTVAGNDIDVYVTKSDCADIPSALSAFSCVTVAQAVGPAARPERLTFSTGADASYRVFAVNRGSQADTVTVTISIR